MGQGSETVRLGPAPRYRLLCQRVSAVPEGLLSTKEKESVIQKMTPPKIQTLVNNFYQPPTPPAVAVSDIYPAGYEIPAGYEAVRFGRVMVGEYWLQPNLKPPTACTPCTGDAEPNFIRIILRPTPKTRVVTFRSTGQKRAPLPGEWYRWPNDMFYLNTASSTLMGVGKPEIWTRTETEE